MLTGAKLTLKRLFYDDSGVAIAYTVMASLFIFMLCVSTYAMSENIRKKLELQNACDAAAYSGAVVQADMLSRIAVLNRALSWTYSQTSKRNMDHIICDWINNINIAYTNCRYRTPFTCSVRVSQYYDCPSCAGGITGYNNVNGGKIPIYCGRCGGAGGTTKFYPPDTPFTGGIGVEACHVCYGGDRHNPTAGVTQNVIGTSGWFIGWDTHEGINLNFNTVAEDSYDVQLSTLRSVRASIAAAVLAQLDSGYANIGSINAAIDFLRRNLNVFVSNAIITTMNNNCNNEGYIWNCGTNNWNSTASPSYLINITSDNSIANKEAYFLNYNNHNTTEFQTGTDVWWNVQTNASGIRRIYTGAGSAVPTTTTTLSARFQYWATLWGVDPYTLQHHFVAPTINGGVNGIVPTDAAHFSMPYSQPVKLSKNFFGKNGSIVVAAKKSMVNPFEIIFGSDDSKSGLYGAFNGTGRDMWAISAARAGVNLRRGGYEVQWPGERVSSLYNSSSIWNLCEEDWDAVMLPVARAWNDTDENRWGSQSIDTTTSNLLNSARSALGVRTPYTSPVSRYNPFNPEAAKR